MSDRKIYKLTARLVSSDEETKRRDGLVFEWMLGVKYLGQSGKNSTIYNSELGMHFENESALTYRYEIEFVDNQVLSSSKLEKSESFIRRCVFRHDWIQLSINRKGQIVSVNNIGELENRWQKNKRKLQVDYQGDVVDNYLTEIDNSLKKESKVLDVVYQYLGFALLFPQVPLKHDGNWNAQRLVEISEYENEKIEEHILYKEMGNNSRLYKISGNELPDNKFQIDKYDGYINIPTNGLLPIEAEVNIDYSNDGINNEWSFKLIKIE